MHKSDDQLTFALRGLDAEAGVGDLVVAEVLHHFGTAPTFAAGGGDEASPACPNDDADGGPVPLPPCDEDFDFMHELKQVVDLADQGIVQTVAELVEMSQAAEMVDDALGAALAAEEAAAPVDAVQPSDGIEHADPSAISHTTSTSRRFAKISS